MIICPGCNGSGEGGPAFVSRVSGCSFEEHTTCSTCNGACEMPDEYPAWKLQGQVLRDDRRFRGLSLGEEARRRGMRPSELSAMEFGKIQPVPEEGRKY